MAFAASIFPPVFAPLRTLFTSPRLPKSRRLAAATAIDALPSPEGQRNAVTRPLRVMREVEPRRRGAAGRMVITGRMADVCAELDRLAALEGGNLRQ